MTLLHRLKTSVQNGLYFLFGTVVILPILLVYVIITIPAMLYRWVVTRILTKLPCCPTGIRKPVTLGFGTSYAAEFITSVSSRPPRQSRNVIVQSTFMSGIIPEQECLEMIQERWITATNSKNKLKYPELKQYVVNWMGYLFWKDDTKFQFKNHVTFHKPLKSIEKFENYCKNFMENMLNKPFILSRSPWEINILFSCGCSLSKPEIVWNGADNQYPRFCVICGKEEKTVFVTRIHHCLGDGISFMFVLMEGLFGLNLSHISEAFQRGGHEQKQRSHHELRTNNIIISACAKLIFPFQKFIQLCCDVGCIATFVLWRINTRSNFHLHNSQKKWTQLYERSKHFPLDQMKEIKNHFRVTFSAVVMSCVAAALSKRVREQKSSKDEKEAIRNFMLAMVVPMPGHPLKRWINFITGTAYKLPLNPDMDPLDRLVECHKIMKTVNESPFTQIVFPMLVKLMSFHIIPIAKFGLYNKWFGAAISNFSVPGDQNLICNEKYPLIDGYATSGGNDGVNGIMIQTLGFRGMFHYMATVDEAVMDRAQLSNLLDDVARETEALLEKVRRTSSMLCENEMP